MLYDFLFPENCPESPQNFNISLMLKGLLSILGIFSSYIEFAGYIKMTQSTTKFGYIMYPDT